MKASRPLAFVVLAFVIGATISQASFAFADDSSTNPFRAIWEAISELQNKTDSLQVQIDDLRAQKTTVAPEQAETRVSEPSVAVEIGSGQVGQTLIQVIARNSGPENAVGVKLSTYYQMALFHVNSIQGAECTDQARGIIECYLGTIDTGSEARVVIDATPSALGQQAIITTDISSITSDANPANNHAEAVFITSEAPVVIQPATPPQVVPQAPQVPQNQTQVQPAPQNSTSQLPEQQVQNQTQSEPIQQQPQNQTQSQPVEQQSGEQGSQPSDQSAQQSDSGSSSESSNSSGSSDAGTSSSGDSGTSSSGGESSPEPPASSGEAGTTG